MLVVAGHLLEPMIRTAPLARVAYNFLYLFHIPVFCFVSGYLSRPELDARSSGRLLGQLLLPYLIFQVLFSGVEHLHSGSFALPLDLLQPHYHLWFLLSLLVWRGSVVVLRHVPLLLPVSVVLGVLVGYWASVGSYLSLSRIFVFAPFFFAGHQARGWRPAWTSWRWLPAVGVVVLVAGALLVGRAGPLLPTMNLLSKQPYAKLGWTAWTAGWHRVAFYAGATALGAAFMACVPRRRLVFTGLGTRTLQTYLLHMLPIMLLWSAARARGVESALGAWPTLGVVLLAATLATGLLSTAWVGRLLRPVLDVRPAWMGVGLLGLLFGGAVLALPVGSLNYPRVPVYSPAELARRSQVAGGSDPSGLLLPARGLAVRFARLQRARELLLEARPDRSFVLRFFRRNRSVGEARLVASTEAGATSLSRLTSRRISVGPQARRRGYDLVVIRPAPASDAARIGRLSVGPGQRRRQ